jgi:hypothetical protein
LKEPASPTNHAGLIWAIADLLRGDYKQSEYGRVILPLVLLRRLDCVLEPIKTEVLADAGAVADGGWNVLAVCALPSVGCTLAGR